MNSDRMLELKFSLLRGAVAILISIGVAAIFIFTVSETPWDALYQLIISPFGNTRQMWNILERMIPLLFTGLAVCVMFSAKQFNLAAEGCVMLGAFVSALIAIYVSMPMGIHPVVAILAGAIVCGLVMLIPSLLQTKFGASVLVSTLMLNFIIQFVIQYFLVHVFADRTQGALMTERFQPTAIIPFIRFETNWGLAVGLVMVVLVSLFLYRTRWGYAIRMVGLNKEFSAYSGMKVAGVIILCQVIGGLLAGMGGGIEMLGYFDRFRWRLLPGYGWNGITIAILAKNNPILVPFAAFFLAYLSRGSMNMAIRTDMPFEMLEIIQAAIFLFFAAEHLMAKTRQKMVVKKAKQEMQSAAKGVDETC
ncbi:MAG: ABC transporter permease [Oscillospiraceae bacterium]|nr:ABC transporter permease [Oscillospiraceae bacterium]